MSSNTKHKNRSRRSHRSEAMGRMNFYRDSINKRSTFDYKKWITMMLSGRNAQVVQIPDNIDADGNVIETTAVDVAEVGEDKE